MPGRVSIIVISPTSERWFVAPQRLKSRYRLHHAPYAAKLGWDSAGHNHILPMSKKRSVDAVC
jgi:hypothetical protein